MSHESSAPHGDPVRIGWVIFLLLAVATAIEYVIAVTLDANLPILIAIAGAKAVLILYYFMHIVRAWAGARGAE